MNIRRKLTNGLRYLHSRFTQNSAILLYHRVAEPIKDPAGLCVSPTHFEQHMAAIREIGVPIAIGDLVQRQREGQLERRSICVTFDDGCLDLLENALPILEKFEIPAAIYCVSGNFGQPFWWDVLIDKLAPPTTLPTRIELNSSSKAVSIETSAQTPRSLFETLYPFFLQLEPAQRQLQLSALGELTDRTAALQQPRMMSEDEVRELAAHPLITIGAHTVSHRRLAPLPTAEQKKEISGSIDHVATVVGTPVTTFSYPFGTRHRDYTSATISAVQAENLDHALAADLGVVTAKSNPFCLPRLWIHDTDGATFRRKLQRWL
jgi:peptidoglycan/xylan/chitin deacetylase (PgdA/CDA1 family)